MPVNKNALLRYKTIDNCLRNRARKWTLDDLIEACSDALYEYTGKDEYVSRRTIQLDLQKMRSDELGYNAPIIVKEKKYYSYEDPEYSITNIPLTENDISLMSEAVGVLRQLSGFSALSGMEDIVGRLQDQVSMVRLEKSPVIYFESNERLVGLNHIRPLYQAIDDKRPVEITYQSFTANRPHGFVFSPYVLKEYRNRWFVYGRRERYQNLQNLALDRIIEIKPAARDAEFINDSEFNPRSFFDDVIGVTKTPSDRPQRVTFWASPEQVPYITTKPLHKSQRILKVNPDSSAVFEIKVVLNYELEREFISFFSGVKVLSPKLLVNHVSRKLRDAADMYEAD